MDTGKIIKVIDDIRSEERTYKLQTRFQNIITYYGQNDVTSINTEKETIRSAVLSSSLSEYVLSDFKVLQKLGGDIFFGPGSYQNLQDILNSQAHEVTPKLEVFVAARLKLLETLNQLRDNLTSLGFETRALEGSGYEIGFMLPDQYSDLRKTEGFLKDTSIFLNALSNAMNDQQPIKIKYVSNGSIEFFINAGVDLASNFNIVIEYMVTIYTAMKAFEDIKKGFKKFSEKRRKKLETETETEKEEQVAALVDELINKLNLSTPDDQNSVKTLFIRMLSHIEQGVAAEVQAPPAIAPQEPADATTEQKKEHKRLSVIYQKKQAIDDRNRQLFVLQQNNFYGMDTKFLDTVDGDEDNKE